MKRLLFLSLSFLFFPFTPIHAQQVNRTTDPVVLTGSVVPSLQNIAPNLLVAFSWTGTTWQQIPVQVDQRKSVDLRQAYNNLTSRSLPTVTYADPNTWIGPDDNPNIDADDEIAFMVKDMGVLPPIGPAPLHTIPTSGVQISATDPLTGATSYTVLFQSDGTLDPGAGQQYVTYQFVLLSGSYKTTFNLSRGPNLENSVITTPVYSHHFGDRWLDDQLHILGGPDLLDRHKEQFAPGDCQRTEDVFDAGEGAFIVNKSGPVRAIRAYIGSDSGPFTERDHFFYANRQDIITYLRVHPISGIVDYFDYAPAANGMHYYDNANINGVLIDGVPDSVAASMQQWELVTGSQGSIAQSFQIQTNAPGLVQTSYYLDSVNPTVTQCSGDAFAYGQSGPWINSAIPCTDLSIFGTKTCKSVFNLNTTRTIRYNGPGWTVADAQMFSQQDHSPLTITTHMFGAP